MTHPHAPQDIALLEELFTAYGTDANSLKSLKLELRHCEDPRAVLLLARVEKALARLSNPVRAIRSSASNAARAAILAGPVAVPVTAVAVPVARAVTAVGLPAPLLQGSDRDVAVPRLFTLPPIAVQRPPGPAQLSLPRPTHMPLYLPLPASTPTTHKDLVPVEAPPLSVEDAYKVLKATPGSTWEAIEHTRRQVVQQSNPDVLTLLREEARTLLIEQAQRANSAYEVLRLARIA